MSHYSGGTFRQSVIPTYNKGQASPSLQDWAASRSHPGDKQETKTMSGTLSATGHGSLNDRQVSMAHASLAQKIVSQGKHISAHGEASIRHFAQEHSQGGGDQPRDDNGRWTR